MGFDARQKKFSPSAGSSAAPEPHSSHAVGGKGFSASVGWPGREDLYCPPPSGDVTLELVLTSVYP